MNSTIDAYRYFFPAGWLLGIWGVLLWLFFPWQWVAYPGQSHPEIMMGGFFLCFVCGFLMTAAPRFTDTFGPTKWDQRISALLIGLLFLSSIFFKRVVFFTVVAIVFVFLISFVLRRFWQRKSSPPDSFVFLGFGLASGLVGCLLLLCLEFFPLVGFFHTIGRLFFLQSYILCLVVGVGSRLVPALLGWAPLPTESMFSHQPKVREFVMLGLIFLGSYVVEAVGWEWWGYLLRSLTLSYIFLWIWKIYRLPKRKAAQSFWLWVSAWLILLGHWCIVFFINYRIHLLHVVFVSGLALMTLMIAVRVTLSHGKHDMSLEKRSLVLFVGGCLIAFAGVTRLSAGLMPKLYQSHLTYAAATWIAGLIVWGWIFIPKILVSNAQKAEADNC